MPPRRSFLLLFFTYAFDRSVSKPSTKVFEPDDERLGALPNPGTDAYRLTLLRWLCPRRQTQLRKFLGTSQELSHRPLHLLQIGAHTGTDFNDPLFQHVLKQEVRGVLVEPVPFYYAQLRRNYARAFSQLTSRSLHKELVFENAAVVFDDSYSVNTGKPGVLNVGKEVTMWALNFSNSQTFGSEQADPRCVVEACCGRDRPKLWWLAQSNSLSKEYMEHFTKALQNDAEECTAKQACLRALHNHADKIHPTACNSMLIPKNLQGTSVPAMTLLEVINGNHKTLPTLDMLVVDTEGVDASILLSFPFAHLPPQLHPLMIQWEHTHATEEQWTEVGDFLAKWGYRMRRSFGHDTYAWRHTGKCNLAGIPAHS